MRLNTFRSWDVVRLSKGAASRSSCCPSTGTGFSIPGICGQRFRRIPFLFPSWPPTTSWGTIQPLAAIGEVAREFGVPWHCDAAQAVGKIPLDVDTLGIDLLSISAHKLYAPKGAGALYVRSNRRPRLRLAAQIEGGGQERGIRSGTINVPGAVGLGRGCEIARLEMAAEEARIGRLRDGLQRKLQASGTAVVNGHPEHRLPGCLSLRFVDVDSGRMMNGLRDKVALSSGSACKSGTAGPSHVLKAIGLDDTGAAETVRFGLGRFSTAEEIDSAGDWILDVIARERTDSVAGGAGRAGWGEPGLHGVGTGHR